MKTSLYLMDYTKEVIKNDIFYKLEFFDTFNGLVFKTYIHEKMLISDINLIDNGNKETIERLKNEVNL